MERWGTGNRETVDEGEREGESQNMDGKGNDRKCVAL